MITRPQPSLVFLSLRGGSHLPIQKTVCVGSAVRWLVPRCDPQCWPKPVINNQIIVRWLQRPR